MTVRYRCFTAEEAKAFLPKDPVVNKHTNEETPIPLDLKFPRAGACVSEEQLNHTLRYVYPAMYCCRELIVAQSALVTYTTAGLFGTGDRDPHHLGAGHVHFEGSPGTGKTYLGTTPRRIFSSDFGRIQCVADTIPADVLGSRIIDFRRDNDPSVGLDVSLVGDNPSELKQMALVIAREIARNNQQKFFKLIKGPAFSDITLYDEMNRMPERSQSAMLESLSEGQITLFGETYPVNTFAIFTTNPFETGAVVDPGKALRDRIMFTIYAEDFVAEDYAEILKRTQHAEDIELPVLGTMDDVKKARRFFHDAIAVSDENRLFMGAILERIKRPWQFPGIVRHFEENPKTQLLATLFSSREREGQIIGAVEGRGVTHLEGAARMLAVLNYRPYVTQNDIWKVLIPVCAHRMDFAPSLLAQYMFEKNVMLRSKGKRMLASDIIKAAFADAYRAKEANAT